MKKNLFSGLLLSLFLCVGVSAFAQMPVVLLHHNGEQTPFLGIDGLKQAYEAAVDNDTIYLPGGAFNQPSKYEKSLTIYGAGFNPDSTEATSSTILYGQMVLSKGTDNFRLEGVHIYSSIKIGYQNDTISHVRVISTRFDGIDGNSKCLIKDAQFIRCICTAGCNLVGYDNFSMKNSIFICGATITNSNSNYFGNNVMISSSSSVASARYLINGNSNFIENNVFIGAGDGSLGGYSNSIYNNINCAKGTDPLFYVNPYTVAVADLFVSYDKATFSWEQDFHLKNPDDYLGTDGTQVGIYGGEFAWSNDMKAFLPSNPHIRAFNTASKTDEGGKLQINVQVGAKD